MASSSSTYDQLVAVLSHPPDSRLNFQLDHLLPWFRKNISLFKNTKSETMNDLIKNARFVVKEPDELIIRQGDVGDCMYILLRGTVAVYIQYTMTDGDNRTQVTQSSQGGATGNKSEMLRRQLGTFVTHIGPGQQFGEVALLSDQVRTASIVTDERSELIVIDRDLYNRSVRDVLTTEFDDKVRFIDAHPHFRKMAPRFRKQLAMALQKRTVPYEGILVRQGDTIDAIYFTLVGELKVTTDPNLHLTQYPKLMADVINTWQNDKYRTASTYERKRPTIRDGQVCQQHRRTALEVCLLGVNKPIGDVEVLLGLKTYMQTAVGSQTTDVLQLELKHFERLFVRRNPRIVDEMMSDVELSMRTRTSTLLLPPPSITAASRQRRQSSAAVPLFDAILRIVASQNAAARQRELLRAQTTSMFGVGRTARAMVGGFSSGTDRKRGGGKRTKAAPAASGGGGIESERDAVAKSASAVTSSRVPSGGVLQQQQRTAASRGASAVDTSGRKSVVTLTTPGAEVQQQQLERISVARQSLLEAQPSRLPGPRPSVSNVATANGEAVRQSIGAIAATDAARFVPTCSSDYVEADPEVFDDVATDDPCSDNVVETENVENRLRCWLVDFSRQNRPATATSAPSGGSSSSRTGSSWSSSSSEMEPRITQMRRCKTPVDGLRPGAKVVFRSRHSLFEHRGDTDAAGRMKSHHDHFSNRMMLEYYKLALTADIPMFRPRLLDQATPSFA